MSSTHLRLFLISFFCALVAAVVCALGTARQRQLQFTAQASDLESGGRGGYGSLGASPSVGGMGGLFPAAGVGGMTPLSQDQGGLREAASVSRLRGSTYGSINVRG
jgi:hypothetical protein